MRTAEEIIQQVHYTDSFLSYDHIKSMINEARMEAIKECAYIAESQIIGSYDILGEDVKESILALIKQVK